MAPFLPLSFSLLLVFKFVYHKVPKFSDAKNLCCNHPKIQTKRPIPKGYFVKMVQMEVANSDDPDQTAPLGAV